MDLDDLYALHAKKPMELPACQAGAFWNDHVVAKGPETNNLIRDPWASFGSVSEGSYTSP